MNTIDETSLDRESLAWLTARECDLASWLLDEVDPQLQERLLCSRTVADVEDP